MDTTNTPVNVLSGLLTQQGVRHTVKYTRQPDHFSDKITLVDKTAEGFAVVIYSRRDANHYDVERIHRDLSITFEASVPVAVAGEVLGLAIVKDVIRDSKVA